MYVCICNGVTTSTVESASKQATSLKDVIKACGACTSCGCCKNEIKRIYNETRQTS